MVQKSYRVYSCGFIDPATLLTAGFLLASFLGGLFVTKVVEQSTENRSQAATVCSCQGSHQACGPIDNQTTCNGMAPLGCQWRCTTTNPPTATPRPPDPTDPPSRDCGFGANGTYACFSWTECVKCQDGTTLRNQDRSLCPSTAPCYLSSTPTNTPTPISQPSTNPNRTPTPTDEPSYIPPTKAPTLRPVVLTPRPTATPTPEPTDEPSYIPPTKAPTLRPVVLTPRPTTTPTPTQKPSATPTKKPSPTITQKPSVTPSHSPTKTISLSPTNANLKCPGPCVGVSCSSVGLVSNQFGVCDNPNDNCCYPAPTPTKKPTPTPVGCNLFNPAACFTPQTPIIPSPTPKVYTSTCSGSSLSCMSALGCNSINGMILTSHSCGTSGTVCCSFAPPTNNQNLTLIPTSSPTPGGLVTLPEKEINPYLNPEELARYASTVADIVENCRLDGQTWGNQLKACFCNQVAGGCTANSIADRVSNNLAKFTTYYDQPNTLQCVEFVCAVSEGVTASLCSYKADAASDFASQSVIDYFLSETDMIWCPNTNQSMVYKPGDIVIFGGGDGHIGICSNSEPSPLCNITEANAATIDGSCQTGEGCVSNDRVVTSQGVAGVWRTTRCF